MESAGAAEYHFDRLLKDNTDEDLAALITLNQFNKDFKSTTGLSIVQAGALKPFKYIKGSGGATAGLLEKGFDLLTGKAKARNKYIREVIDRFAGRTVGALSEGAEEILQEMNEKDALLGKPTFFSDYIQKFQNFTEEDRYLFLTTALSAYAGGGLFFNNPINIQERKPTTASTILWMRL